MNVIPLTVGSLYVPKGASWEGPDAGKHGRKMRFLASLGSYLTRARREAARQGREARVEEQQRDGDAQTQHEIDRACGARVAGLLAGDVCGVLFQQFA